MNEDVRYHELRFLQALAANSIDLFNPVDKSQQNRYGPPRTYVEMGATLIEDLYVRFKSDDIQTVVAKLRGELSPSCRKPYAIDDGLWDDPRRGILQLLWGNNNLHGIQITYRGLRRIAELQDLLKAERILEPFGITLSMQYFRRDLEDALKSRTDVPVSVLYCDLDNFKRINSEFGHKGGDIVMRTYLDTVRNALDPFGTAYRGVGDEVAAIVIGEGHVRAVNFADTIRSRIQQMHCELDGQVLPSVTASLGVATTPPEARTIDIETIAEDRHRLAKESGKNRVVAKETFTQETSM